jgi:hypothetical protein
MTRHMSVDFARKVLGQRSAKGLGRCRPVCGSDGLRLFNSASCPQLFKLQLKLQLKLVDLAEDLFALRAEKHPLKLLDQQHQAVDLARARVERGRISLMPVDQHRLQRCGIESVQIGQAEDRKHERSMSQTETD